METNKIKKIIEYFASLNLHILELFGQSECTGPHTFNTVDAWKIGTCGRPMVVSGRSLLPPHLFLFLFLFLSTSFLAGNSELSFS